MTLTEIIIRALFLLVSGALGYRIADQVSPLPSTAIGVENPYAFRGILIGIGFAALVIGLELLFRKRPVQSVTAVIFGVVAGFILATLLSNVTMLVIDDDTARLWGFEGGKDELANTVRLIFIVVCCFLCVSVIYGTRDRFRFIIPYVEFQREEKGARPILIDTSAIIDGRLAEICGTNIFDSPLLVPKFVLQELQHVADSPDRLRRNRGRRGIEVLQRIQRDEKVEVQIHDGRMARGGNVDSKLLSLAGMMQCRILTCDYNLAKIAELQGVEIINMNDLANALKPIAMQGEEMNVKVIRTGEEPGQGVGYLSDGTMVVIENARDKVNQFVTFSVTNTLQTSAGRMIFGRVRDGEEGNPKKEA